ncbi:MAG: NAD-dependent epimerase/dehydratase family protein [Bacteriovoracaceae bacterium]
MERWLVTGAAGFLGSHVIEQLVKMKKKVFAIDNLSWGHKDFLNQYEGQLDFYKTDLRDKGALDQALKIIQPTHVVHLAALHFIPLAIKNPSLAVDINVRGTQNLLQSLRENTSYKTFWFASTGDVYAPSEAPHHETESEIAPFNIYGLTKLMGEQLIKLESKNCSDKAFIIGRLFNLYGARETNPHILPEILGQIKAQTGEVRLSLGNVWPKRDMVPIDEAATCIIESLEKVIQQKAGWYCMNYATGKAISMEEMIKALAKILGRPIHIEIDQNKVRGVERAHLEAHVKGLQTFIGKSPSSDLESGLKKLLKSENLI